MPGFFVLAVTLVIGFILAILESHRANRRQLRLVLGEVRDAKSSGSAQARLQYPWVDLSRCIGCGTCVAACPEHGVLDLLHGQAAVVHGSRCVGHGLCAKVCPVDGIVLTLGDLAERSDIPALSNLEAVGQDGLFLAGEVSGHALIRTAVRHGRRVAEEVAQRLSKMELSQREGIFDLCIVGAGPAGIACALEAKRLGLNFTVLEQQTLGGTVAKYPRRKLVMTEPLKLPLGPTLKSKTYRKEELIDLWHKLAKDHALPIKEQVTVQSVAQNEKGHYLLASSDGLVQAQFVCLALGRRGTPRILGVPGEQLQKVAYSLIDARAYQDRDVLVVGGGDSAVEAALALSRQPKNRVHVSYRREGFFRLKARNQMEALEAIRVGRIQPHFGTTVVAIEEERVLLKPAEISDGSEGCVTACGANFAIKNDDVFVMAGGLPPFPFLKDAGVSFDPAFHPQQPSLAEKGTGLRPALYFSLLMAMLAFAFYYLNLHYFDATLAKRVEMDEHNWYHSSRSVGLGLGVAAACCMVANLLYLLRRAQWFPLSAGSLRSWMSAHVGTGLLAFLLALGHSTFSPQSSLAGHALLGLGALVVTGAIGRYFYSYVPRATNGRELALEEAMEELQQHTNQWRQLHRSFSESARQEISELLERTRWQRGFWGSLRGLIDSKRQLRLSLHQLREQGLRADIDKSTIRSVLQLARRIHQSSLATSHLDDLNSLLSSWRYFHRWIALLVVLLVIAHVVTSVRFIRWELF